MPACSRKFIVFVSAGLAVLGGAVWFSRHDRTAAPASAPATTTISQPARVKNWPTGPRTKEEIDHTAQARPCDRTVLTYLDLSRVPTQGELIAAGNLGEPLTPTRQAEATAITEPAQRARQEKDNLAFGTAIQAWNQHRYEEAYSLFEAHLVDFKDSAWTAEVQLHLGCFCQYNGRLAESAEWFDKILSTVEPKSEMYNKAKLRRSILLLDQGNLEASLLGFTEMKRDDLDPQHQSYASYWIREIALLKKNETALRDCGQKALARVEEILGAPEEARKLREMMSPGPEGFTARELHATALLRGLDSRPVHADTALDDLPVPFVAHYLDRHYVTVEQVSGDDVRLFDSRVGEATMPRKAFMKQWSGFALIFRQPSATAAIHPAVNLDTIVGGCCGHPRSPADLGDDDCEKNCGMPGWSVNPVNFNFRVGDTPMWWNPPVGPGVSMSLLFNSLDSLTNYDSFGAKWSFEYASYLLITPGGQVQVRDGDGRLETFTAGSPAGIYPVSRTSPSYDFRQLIEASDHVFTLTHQNGTIYHYGVPAAMAGNSSVPLLLSIEDLHGNSVNITHNAQGAITAVGHSMLPATLAAPGVPAAERNWVFTYDVFNGHSRVTRIDDPFVRSASFGYDNEGNLRTQTDMGGLAYGYDYTTKLSQDAISTNLNQTTGFAAATLELFISAIHTPKGTTTIFTEPSDGVTNYPVTQGYTTSYPPLGSPGMWTNYRIRITNPENKTEEYSFDGNTDGITARAYYRNAVQLSRTAGQSFYPTSGPNTSFKISVVGGVRGRITETAISGNSEGGILSEKTFSPTSLKTTSVKGPDGKTTTYEYNSNGKLKTLTLPKGDVIAGGPATDPYKIHYSYENNDLDKVQRYLTLNGSLETLLDIDYWPGTRDVKQTTDALGHITSYALPHPNGLPTSVTDVTTGDAVTFTYDQGSDDADGYPTWRLLKVKRNGSMVSHTEYDDIGRPAMVSDATGDYVQPGYDGLNRLIRSDYSDSTFTEQIWECCHVGETRAGNVVAGQDRVNDRTKIFHDHRGLPTMSIDTAGKITRLGYDDAGRMTTLTDSMNRVTTWKYDAVGRMEKKIYPDTTYEKITWLNLAQPEMLRNRRGQVATVSFDSNGNLKTVTGSGVNLAGTYDGWDRLKTIVDSNYSSSAHTYEYDLLGRVTSLDGPWTGTTDTISWEYVDADRKVIRTSPGGVTETIIGDSLARIGSVANPLGTFTPGYDGDSDRLMDITHSGGFDTAFTYLGADEDRALETITSKLPNATTIAKHTYGYDDQGRINSWKREAPLANPSGTTHSYRWTNYYDFSSQLTAVAEKSLTGNLESGWDYQHDLAGNITSVQNSSVSGGPVALTRRNHNPTNQITSLGGGGTSVIRGTLSEPGEASVGLTGSGDKPARMLADNRFETELPLQPGSNSVAIAATDTSGNRSNYQFQVDLPSANVQPLLFTYDPDGNLTSDGIRSYEWDILSRLTKITWATGKTTAFKYNALGQRCDRTDTDGSTVTKHFYLFDGIQMLDHRSGSTASTATVDRRYFAQGEQRKNGTNWENYFYCRDHLGSIREVVKSTGGTNTLVARYDYDPYGKRLTQYEASGYACDFGYTGHDTIPSLVTGQSEMVLTFFRAYDPELGRWLSPDPIGEMGGMNLYEYVGGNPLNYRDSLGLDKDQMIVIDLDKDTLTIFGKDKKQQFSCDIVHGDNSNPATKTSVGNFKLGQWQKNKTGTRFPGATTEWDKSWWGGNVYGPYFVPIVGSDGEGIHGTRGLANGTWGAAKLLSPVSHGCVRVANENIIEMHDKILPNPNGTPVRIIQSPPRPPAPPVAIPYVIPMGY